MRGIPDYRDNSLWRRLESCPIGPENAEFRFEDRLARENGWSLEHANRVIGEYRRFCFLAMVAGHDVTPSDAVDQAWHLHLTYTRDYWGKFCPDVLCASLHHGPTSGGQVERQRYYTQYADTLAAYEAIFGTPPPDIWPTAAKRFGRDPFAVRVDPADFFVVPKLPAIAVTVLVTCLLALLLFLLIAGT